MRSFRENKTLAKISEFTVPNFRGMILVCSPLKAVQRFPFHAMASKRKTLQNLLVQKNFGKFENNLKQMVRGYPLPRKLKKIDSLKNMATREWDQFFLFMYMYKGKHKKIFLLKITRPI